MVVFHVFKIVQMAPNRAKHHYRLCVEHKWFEEGMAYAIFKIYFRAKNRVEIRFSDNPWQKETTDDMIWLGKKVCNLII